VTRIDVAQALLERDGRILAVRNRPHEAWRDEFWGLPGGRVEPGESTAEAAVRETLEETGARIEVERLVAVGEWLHETHDVFFVFAARLVGGEPAVQPDEPVVVEVRWLEPDEADALMPWYPGGVRALLAAGEPLYYVERT
jgi:8-oxo-dGTP diphosphatase